MMPIGNIFALVGYSSLGENAEDMECSKLSLTTSYPEVTGRPCFAAPEIACYQREKLFP